MTAVEQMCVAAAEQARTGRMLRLIAYFRTSTGKQKRSIPEQQADVAELVALMPGWEIVIEIVESGASASRYNSEPRKGWLRILDALQNGDADGVLVWDMDRLLRQCKELEALIDLADRSRGGRSDIRLFGFKRLDYDEDGSDGAAAVEYGLQTADDRKHLRDIVSGNERESDKISQRVKRSRRAYRRTRSAPFARAYGWRSAYEHDPVEAVHVAMMILAVLNGDSLASIARRLNAAGTPRTRGTCAWDFDGVRSVVTTPRHYGLVVAPDCEPQQRGGVESNKQYRARMRGSLIRGVGADGKPLVGIVEPELYAQVLRVLDSRAVGYRPKRAGNLAGLIHCVGCGQPLLRNTGGNGRLVLRCVKGLPGPTGTRCGLGSIDHQVVLDLVQLSTFRYVDTLDLSSLVKPAPDTTLITNRLARIADKRASNTRMWKADSIDDKQYEETARDLATEEAQLTAQLVRTVKMTSLNPYAGKAGALAAAWDTLTAETQRQIITDTLGLRKVRLVVDSPPPRSNRRWHPSNPEFPAMVAAEQARLREEHAGTAPAGDDVLAAAA